MFDVVAVFVLDEQVEHLPTGVLEFLYRSLAAVPE